MAKKQSLLMGALAGSFGIFISKLLGLFYVVPLNSLAGESNMAFYSITYTYYDLLLKICSAGIPFAIAALVAKYLSRDDYKTVLLIKKLGASFSLALSFIVAIVFLLISSPLASAVLGSEATASDIKALNDLFYILSLALILVPFLSALRGYYQGLKLMKEYAASQVIEQLVRVSGIIILGFICVSILHLDSIYAIYMAIFSAALGALFAIIYVLRSAKDTDKEITLKAQSAIKEARDSKALLREMLALGVPYLIISFLGTTSALINSNLFIDFATTIGIDYEEAMLALGILQVNCNKIAAIPQVLTLGFSAGLVPYLTESLERRDMRTLRSYISQILETVLFFLIPIVIWLIIYARPVYYIMYGGSNLDLGTDIFIVSSLTTFTDTIAPIISSMCMTLRQRRSTILILLASTIIKLATFYPCVILFGYNGMTISTAIASIVAIALNLFILYKSYGASYRRVYKRALFMLIAALISCLPLVLTYIGFDFNYDSRIICILILAIFGILSLILYFGVASFFGLIKALFKKDLKGLIQDIKLRFFAR